MARAIDADELEMFPYSEGAGTEEQISEWIEQAGLSEEDTADRARLLCWKVIEGYINVVKTQSTLTPPSEPLTCGLVDRHGMPLRAGDTVAADKFFVYAVRYGSHNVNPDNCAPAYQVGWYLEIMWAYPGFEDSVGHTEPLYDIDGTAARYPAHCADTADGLYNLKLEVCCRPPEGEEDT